MKREAKIEVAIAARSVIAGIGVLALLYAASATDKAEKLPVERLGADCTQDAKEGNILSLSNSLPESFVLELHDGIDSRHVTVRQNTGHLVVGKTVVFGEDAGKELLTLDDGTRLIAGAPSPQRLDSYYAGDEALTLACKKATPESIAQSLTE